MENILGFRDIPGYEGLYGITSCGKVWSYKRKKFLKPGKNGHGYESVVLSKDGERCTLRVNRLVALTYIPNPEDKAWVDHIDGVRDHNWVSNLRWVTP